MMLLKRGGGGPASMFKRWIQLLFNKEFVRAYIKQPEINTQHLEAQQWVKIMHAAWHQGFMP
jgi:hypothetical protein